MSLRHHFGWGAWAASVAIGLFGLILLWRYQRRQSDDIATVLWRAERERRVGAQWVCTRLHFQDITVVSNVARAQADVDCVWKGVVVSAIGSERVSFHRLDGGWVPDRSLLPRLDALVSALGERAAAPVASWHIRYDGDVAQVTEVWHAAQDPSGQQIHAGQRHVREARWFEATGRWRVSAPDGVTFP